MRKSKNEYEPTTAMLSIYDGQRCIGFMVLRGKCGVEAFDADGNSLGTFADQKRAADAVSTKAVRQ
jgi:hypothetical protein